MLAQHAGVPRLAPRMHRRVALLDCVFELLAKRAFCHGALPEWSGQSSIALYPFGGGNDDETAFLDSTHARRRLARGRDRDGPAVPRENRADDRAVLEQF